MTSKGKDQFDDEFDAFLHRRDVLSWHLQSLPQPEPSAELDAAILARAEAELARSAANDPAMPGTTGRALPAFLKRWYTPLAVAASVLFAFLLLMRWQAQPENPAPLVVAQAPQSAAPAADAPPEPPSAAISPTAQSSARTRTNDTLEGKPLAAKSQAVKQPQAAALQTDPQIASLPDSGRDAATPPIQIAQTDTQESIPRTALPAPVPATAMPPAAVARAPVPAAVLARPPVADTAATSSNTPDPEKAKAWVALIEELLKADLRHDALAEWDRFRKAYPHYQVPKKLEARIKALKQHPG